jgi:anti-sigma B factor antagonist
MGSDVTPLQISVSTGDGGDVTLRVDGEVNFVNAPQLRKELVRLIDGDTRSLVIDLAGLTFMDSSGLSTLIVAWQAAQRRGVALALDSVPAFFGQVLVITGLHTVLPIRSAGTAGAAPA